MVRADQGIRGRAAPKAKARSSVTSSFKSRDQAAKSAPPPQQITKAAKRAMKRAELMTQAKTSADQTKSSSTTSLLNLGTKPMSRTSLKRFKKRQKQQLAGNSQGMKDLEEAMEEIQEEIVEEQDRDLDPEMEHDEQPTTYVPSHQRSSSKGLVGSERATKTVTEKARKKALSTEMQRQNLILKDPAYAQSPFAALRLHAQNTLVFDKGAPRRSQT